MKACVCLLIFSTAVSAAPMLRLSNSVVTAQAAVGGSVAAQALTAYNAGDGTISVSASVSPAAPWLVAAVSQAPCSYSGGVCDRVQFTFNTSGLAAGSYTASVMVSDPNALDSPQVVIVRLQVGNPFFDQYMAPGAVLTLASGGVFCGPGGGCGPGPVASTADGGGWLKVYVSAGTIMYDYSIELAPPASMAPGNYIGNVFFPGSAFQGSSYNIPVSMHLTTLPIAVPSTAQINLQLAQNGPATTYPFLPFISLTNSGMGTLQVTGVSGSGTGVSAYNYNGLAIVTVDPGSLAPGIYTDGLVTIQCNGANCPLQIPVTLEVDPQGPPVVNYQGVLDNATFSTTGSPGDVMVVKGTQLSFEAPQTASGNPLPTTLGGASVLVNGVATPLYYSSFGQIAFQARADTYLGTALVQVVRDGQAGNTVSVNMSQYAPGIVVVTDASYNVVDATHPAHAGETLVFWALGLGPTNPAVADGAAAPASPPALVTMPVSVQFGGDFFYNTTTPSFVGLSPGSVGLYQVVATLPTIGFAVSASLQLPGGRMSNAVTIGVQ
jgi:uncharacterized protein (TIGR03437 family)